MALNFATEMCAKLENNSPNVFGVIYSAIPTKMRKKIAKNPNFAILTKTKLCRKTYYQEALPYQMHTSFMWFCDGWTYTSVFFLAINFIAISDTNCRWTRHTKLTNPTMHVSHIPQCTIQNRNAHISVLNGVLWDMEQLHYRICEVGQPDLTIDRIGISWPEFPRLHVPHARATKMLSPWKSSPRMKTFHSVNYMQFLLDLSRDLVAPPTESRVISIDVLRKSYRTAMGPNKHHKLI